MKKFLPILLPIFLAGCASITNLTPSKQDRNATGLYPFEVVWESNQQSLRADSMKPQVIIGLESYPMQPTPLVKNRWETLIPVGADKNLVHYRYKFDFDYNAIPVVRKDSKMSPEYTLEIVEKK